MPKEEKDYKTNDNLIIGRNAVIELLKSGREVENVLISKGEREGSINRIVAMCKENKIVVKTVDRKKNFFLIFFQRKISDEIKTDRILSGLSIR